MRVIFPFLGILSIAGALTTSPLEPGALGDFCTGLTTAVSLADNALSIKNKPAPDAEIDRRRLEAVNALIEISAKFQPGIERGALFSQAGSMVAKDFISTIEIYISGKMYSRDVKKMVGPLTKRVNKLLGDAKEMHIFFGAIQTDVEHLEFNLNNDEAHISNYISRLENEIEEARQAREAEMAFGGMLLLLAPFFPPAAVGAIGLGSMALDHDEVVQDSKGFRNILQHSLGDVRHLKAVVEGAKRATAVQIQYWSQTLDQLASLQVTSRDWLEDPISKWTTKKVLEQWKVVLQKYSECSQIVSDAGRHIQGCLRLLDHS